MNIQYYLNITATEADHTATILLLLFILYLYFIAKPPDYNLNSVQLLKDIDAKIESKTNTIIDILKNH